MRDSASRLTGFAQAVLCLLLAAATAAPAAAQFGGLKKKARAAAGVTEEKPAQPAAAPAGGGTIVLSDDVINRLIEGLRAGKAYREAAAKDSKTPYGQYLLANTAYSAAKAKCDAAAQTYGQRIAADQKLAAKSQALLDKMIAAQQKQDTALQRAYGDSLLGLQDPSCMVKQPRQPDNWYDLQREVDSGAEQQELKASGFDRQELGAVRERTEAILRDAPGADISASEKDAVKKRSDQLKKLMNIDQPPPARAEKPAPAAAPAAPPQQAAPTVSAEQSAALDCMSKNAQKHEKEMQRLGERAQAAANAGDTQTAMAIADSIRRLQMAGCEAK